MLTVIIALQKSIINYTPFTFVVVNRITMFNYLLGSYKVFTTFKVKVETCLTSAFFGEMGRTIKTSIIIGIN